MTTGSVINSSLSRLWCCHRWIRDALVVVPVAEKPERRRAKEVSARVISGVGPRLLQT